MNRRTVWLVVVLTGVGFSAARQISAAVGLADESRALAGRFDHVQALVKDQLWAEALDELQDILDKQGDALVPAAPEHLVAARKLVHQRIAALPPDGLRLYRARVDAQARKWLDLGTTARDERQLRRVLDEAFASRHGDRALDLLGDLAFERGDLEEADRYWQMLLPAAASAPPGVLTYPDPRTSAALVRARQMLARLFRRADAVGPEQLQEFRARFGQEEGWLAGQKGNLADILEQVARQPDLLPLQPASRAWTTFAGTATRQLLAPAGPRSFAFDLWRVHLDGSAALALRDEDGPTLRAAAQGTPTVHPVIAGQRVLIANHRAIFAFDLRTGRRLFRCDLVDQLNHGVPETQLQTDANLPPPRITLTVADKRVYARLGPTTILGGPGPGGSVLVCLDLLDAAPGFQLRWLVPAQLVPADPPAFFEGAPLVHGGRAYAARTRQTGGQVVTAIVCLDADTGAPRWSRDVCSVPQSANGDGRTLHQLLTLAGPNLVLCSHTGAVAALDAATGRPAWAVRYPTRGPRTDDGDLSPRDLAPPVYAEGRLFVAPADCDRVLCLDSDTGRTLWESKPVEVQHLLGVARDRLIFTTGSRPRGIRALVASTGADLRSWLQPDDGTDLPSYGRGFLAGDLVFWPTPYGLRLLGQEDGQPPDIDPTRLRHVRPGNLAFGEGCLAVAGTQELTVYVPAGQGLQPRQADVEARPGSAPARYRLALALADQDQLEAALAELVQVQRLAGQDDMEAGRSLRDEARLRQHDILLTRASQAAADGRWDRAAADLRQAAGLANPAGSRLAAWCHLFDVSRKAGQDSQAIEAAHAVFADPALRDGVVAWDGNVQRGGDWFMEAVSSLGRREASLLAPWERQADQMLAAARGPGAEERLWKVASEYPLSKAANTALMRLAGDYQDAGRPGAAAHAYRTAWRQSRFQPLPEPDTIVKLQAGLARAYELQHCWQAAAATWRMIEWMDQMAARMGVDLPPIEAGQTLKQSLAARLRNPMYQARVVVLPLQRVWHAPVDEGRLVQGGAGSEADGDALLFLHGARLSCRDVRTGRLRWQLDLPEEPAWLGRAADVVLVGGPDGLHGRRLEDGRPVWHFRGADADMASSGPLSGFQVMNRLVLFFQGPEQLFSLDSGTGSITRVPVPSCCRLRPPESPPTVIGAPGLVAVRAADGRYYPLGTRDQATAALVGPWPCPPVALGRDLVCLAPDARRIVMVQTERVARSFALTLDLAAGRSALQADWPDLIRWTYVPERTASLTGEPPRLLADRQTVVVAVGRNYGYELQVLNSEDGKPHWPAPVLVSRRRVDLDHGAIDERAVYLPTDGTLHALALADGRPLWQLPLGDAGTTWQVMRLRNMLAVFPRQTLAAIDPAPAILEFGRRWRERLRHGLPVPGRGECQRLATALSAAWSQRRFPVLLCDPADGRLIQRLNFPAVGLDASVVACNGVVVVALASGTWGLTCPEK